MAGSTGLEPATSGLTVQCANQAAPRARIETSVGYTTLPFAASGSVRNCREHMICPLPRANDLTALSRPQGWDSHRGGGDDLHQGGGGAGHEGAGSHLARIERTAIVVAGSGPAGSECAHRATTAVAVPEIRVRRIVGPA